jgi:hypothetical protein
MASHVSGQFGEVGTGKADAAPVGSEITGDKVEQRRLAGAVRPDDAEGLALGNDERKVLHDLERAETLPEVDNFQ